MKVISGVVAAGVLVGAVALAPKVLGGAPAAGQSEYKAAPVNPYNGMQEREEVFEFTEKPKVTKAGDKWVITFASKGKCDATVSILDKDGKIVRHLASGVLGKNAPYPFKQDSLAQKIEWDGLTDDFKKVDTAGCKVKVSLGLKAVYERSMLWDPYEIPKDGDSVLVGTDADGNLYVGGKDKYRSYQGRVFDKAGKYVRTFCPAPAAEVEKDGKAPPVGYAVMCIQEREAGVVVANGGIPPVTPTAWGDKAIIGNWFGPFTKLPILEARFAKLGIKDVKESPLPAVLPAAKPSMVGVVFPKISNLAVDRENELLYAGFTTVVRFDGKTGELDQSWFPKGEVGNSVSEFAVGPGGVLVVRYGGSSYGRWMIRIARDGKIVPFTKDVVQPTERLRAFKTGELGAVFCGTKGFSVTWQPGMKVSPGGLIATSLCEVDYKWGKEHNLPGKLGNWPGTRDQSGGGVMEGTYTAVWSPDGDCLTTNAVEGQIRGNGTAMDRDGNIYIVQGDVLPAGQKTLDGTPHFDAREKAQGGFGSLIKFRGQGGKYPLGKIIWTKEAAPDGAVKLNRGYATGALWAYGGITGQSNRGCNCNYQRFDLDPWARIWIPATHLFSVMVLDTNGNRIARLGRYGNVDDTEADLKAKRDGIRFCWLRSTAASDSALYVSDPGNRRILKAALSYAAEETVPAP